MRFPVEHAMTCMGSIIKLYGLSDRDAADYVSAIHRACADMEAFRFQGVCDRVLARAGQYKPKPSDFRDAYSELIAANRSTVSPHSDCPKCGGSKWERLFYKHTVHGGLVEAVKPCSCGGQSYRLALDFQPNDTPEGYFAEVSERDWAEAHGETFVTRWKWAKAVAQNVRDGTINAEAAMTVALHKAMEKIGSDPKPAMPESPEDPF